MKMLLCNWPIADTEVRGCGQKIIARLYEVLFEVKGYKEFCYVEDCEIILQSEFFLYIL